MPRRSLRLTRPTRGSRSRRPTCSRLSPRRCSPGENDEPVCPPSLARVVFQQRLRQRLSGVSYRPRLPGGEQHRRALPAGGYRLQANSLQALRASHCGTKQPVKSEAHSGPPRRWQPPPFQKLHGTHPLLSTSVDNRTTPLLVPPCNGASRSRLPLAPVAHSGLRPLTIDTEEVHCPT